MRESEAGISSRAGISDRAAASHPVAYFHFVAEETKAQGSCLHLLAKATLRAGRGCQVLRSQRLLLQFLPAPSLCLPVCLHSHSTWVQSLTMPVSLPDSSVLWSHSCYVCPGHLHSHHLDQHRHDGNVFCLHLLSTDGPKGA